MTFGGDELATPDFLKNITKPNEGTVRVDTVPTVEPVRTPTVSRVDLFNKGYDEGFAYVDFEVLPPKNPWEMTLLDERRSKALKLTLTPSLHEDLKAWAEEKGTSVTNLIFRWLEYGANVRALRKDGE